MRRQAETATSMSSNREAIGQALRRARENRGLTQQNAAEHVGLSRSLVAQIELGNRPVSSEELAQFARLYQKSITEFSPAVQRTDEDVLNGVASSLPARVRPVLESFLDLCREAVTLEQSLGRPRRVGPPRYNLTRPRNTADAIVQGEQVAAQERQRLGLGPGSPIWNVTDVVTSQGVRAGVMRLPEDVIEIFIWHREFGPLVIGSAQETESRRFQLLHGYAHALFESDQSFSTTVLSADEIVEVRANAFAAAFLLPRDGIETSISSLDKGRPSRRALAVFGLAAEEAAEAVVRSTPGSQTLTYHDVARIAHRFGASYEATVYRFRALDLISKADTERFMSHEQLRAASSYAALLTSDSKTDRSDGFGANADLKSEVMHLAVEAYRRQQINKAALAALAPKLQFSELTPKKLLELAEAAR